MGNINDECAEMLKRLEKSNLDLISEFVYRGRWTWSEHSEFGAAFYAAKTGRPIDPALEEVLQAVAAAANQGAYEAVAAMLNLDPEWFAVVAYDWECSQDQPRPWIDFPLLEKLIQERKSENMRMLEEWKVRRADLEGNLSDE